MNSSTPHIPCGVGGVVVAKNRHTLCKASLSALKPAVHAFPTITSRSLLANGRQYVVTISSDASGRSHGSRGGAPGGGNRRPTIDSANTGRNRIGWSDSLDGVPRLVHVHPAVADEPALIRRLVIAVG